MTSSQVTTSSVGDSGEEGIDLLPLVTSGKTGRKHNEAALVEVQMGHHKKVLQTPLGSNH